MGDDGNCPLDNIIFTDIIRHRIDTIYYYVYTCTISHKTQNVSFIWVTLFLYKHVTEIIISYIRGSIYIAEQQYMHNVAKTTLFEIHSQPQSCRKLNGSHDDFSPPLLASYIPSYNVHVTLILVRFIIIIPFCPIIVEVRVIAH